MVLATIEIRRDIVGEKCYKRGGTLLQNGRRNNVEISKSEISLCIFAWNFQASRGLMVWRMPATVVDNQQAKFENDTEINQLKGPTPIAYAGCPHAPKVERCETLIQGCSDRQRPHLPLTFTQYGYCSDFVLTRHAVTLNEVLFESRFILNGVCVILNGTLNKETLSGTATLNFDKTTAALEERKKREFKEHYGQRIRALQHKFNISYFDS